MEEKELKVKSPVLSRDSDKSRNIGAKCNSLAQNPIVFVEVQRVSYLPGTINVIT